MKYIKSFENTNFEPGDYVYANDKNKYLNNDTKYQISKIINDMIILNNYPNRWFNKDTFMSEIEYNSTKYNI